MDDLAGAGIDRTLAEVAFHEGRRLEADPNIRSVGYGAKLRHGLPSGGGSLVFLVREKLATEEAIARGSWPVPPSIEGFPTDVIEVGELAAATANRAPPTGSRGTLVATSLVGGTATMALGSPLPGPAGYGTLGGICFDANTNAPLLLSNAHVWGQTNNTEIVQPVMASTVFGAAATPASVGTPPATVVTRAPSAMAAPIAFANSVSQTYLVAGGDADPLPFGQGATPVPGTTRTDSEQVTITAPTVGLPPAGRRVTPTVTWAYQRFATTSVLQASATAAQSQSKLLAARRLFTNAATYTSGQTVNLYAEIIPAAGGAPVIASSHLPVAFLYPLPAGDRFLPRLLRPTARQTVTTVTTQFTGFPAPSRVGNVRLPFVVAGAFTVDSDGLGVFQTATAGTLPAGTLALKLPSNTVRLFVPPARR